MIANTGSPESPYKTIPFYYQEWLYLLPLIVMLLS